MHVAPQVGQRWHVGNVFRYLSPEAPRLGGMPAVKLLASEAKFAHLMPLVVALAARRRAR